ncbi:UNVERIFIED_CONTAM: hypothetical protein Sangu_1596400 [Sesamum angustifolium]|uniref:Uncharacterized protein n=1 Tax=Sesamum angustifolium TaxID=2727405 RepID=A0AAW2MST9_9LAMI
MGSKVFVTYKRKRLFSRSDHPHIDLLSDTPSDIKESKISANFDKHDESIAECILQKEGREFGICHEYTEENIGENVLQCENCDSEFRDQCNKEHAANLQRLCAACTKQQDSSVSEETQNLSKLEQGRRSPKSDVKQLTSNPNVLLEGSPSESCQIDSAGQSKLLSVKSSSEYEDKCKDTFSISPPPAFVVEPKPACLENSDGKNCSPQMDGTAISGAFNLEETNKTNKEQPSSLCNNLVTKRKLDSTLITFCRDPSGTEISLHNILPLYMLIQHVHLHLKHLLLPVVQWISRTRRLNPRIPLLVMKTKAMHMDNPFHFPHGTAEKSATVAVAQTFQDSHEEMSSLQGEVCMDDKEVCHDSPGSTCKNKEILPSLQVHYTDNGSAVRSLSDNGKFIVDSPPFLAGSSSQTNYSSEQFFIVSKGKLGWLLFQKIESNDTPQLARRPGKGEPAPRSSLQPFTCSMLISGIRTDGRAQSFLRHKMILDNILMRTRAVREAEAASWTSFEHPTTWLEEELDCLWIGVRRHGRDILDAILRDRQATLPGNFLFFGQVAKKQSNFPATEVKMLGRYLPAEAVEIPPRPSDPTHVAVSSVSHCGTQWLNGPNFECTVTSQQPWLSNRYASVLNIRSANQPLIIRHGKTEPHEREVNKKDDMIVIPSDASSEETISDDHSIRP